MLLHLARRWSRALKAVMLLVLPLPLVSCPSPDYRAAAARVEYHYSYLTHHNWAAQALTEEDCATAEWETREAIESAKRIKELVPDKVDADVVLGEAYHLLGQVYASEECARPAEAVGPYRQALGLVEEALGPDHPNVAETLNNLGWAYYLLGRYGQAEPLLVRALEIYQASIDASLKGSMPQLNLAKLYLAEGRYTDAEGLFQRSLDAVQRAHLSGEASGKHVAGYLRGYAGFLRQTGRLDEAKKLELRARTIESEEE